LLGIQPTRKQKSDSAGTADGDSNDEILKQAKKGLKKLENDLVEANQKLETAESLLTAVADLLSIQEDSKEGLNILEQNVMYDETECDGHTMLEEVQKYIEG
jgi:hypothetical protein